MHPIQWDASKRLVTIDGKTIQLTATESHLLSLLQPDMPISYDTLALSTYNCVADHKIRIAMDKHIERIRGKLRDTNISIYCVKSYGYVLLYGAKEKPQGVLTQKAKENE